jgi:GH24 family phage-related lysozyme (muramidase)
LTKQTKYIVIASIVILLLMSTSNAYASLLSFIKKWEEDNKAALIAYDDGTGTWTIGYGSIWNYDLLRPVQQGDQIDQATADRWLQLEATSKINEVKKLVKVKINNNQLIALSSFAYNEGIGAFSNSTLLKLLNAGADKATVAAQFDRWIYAGGSIMKGLQARRAAEKNLFLS